MHARDEGYIWATQFSTYPTFTGDFVSSTLKRLKLDMDQCRNMIHNGISYQYPPSTQPKNHAIFTEILRKAYDQVVGWLESLDLLFRTMTLGGMSEKEARRCCLVYTKSIFRDVHPIRSISAEKTAASMIWGSFGATKFFDEYHKHQ